MIRVFSHTLVCLLLASVTSTVHAQDNPLGALWPFGKGKAATPSFNNIDPFKSPTTSSPSKTLGLPSPMKMIDSAEKKTGAMFRKTRDSLKDMQNFGKSLNPFAKPAKPKAKKSLLDTFFPKQPVQASSPSTMNDFMKLKRPKF